jgi:hypothetical protein
MRSIPNRQMPHRNTSWQPVGEGANGRVFGPAQPVPRALVVQKTSLVKSTNGEQIASSTQVWTDATNVITVNSRFTIHIGTPWEKTSTVIAVEHYDSGGLIQPYIIVYLE